MENYAHSMIPMKFENGKEAIPHDDPTQFSGATGGLPTSANVVPCSNPVRRSARCRRVTKHSAEGFVSQRTAEIDNDLPTIHGLTHDFFTNANPV